MVDEGAGDIFICLVIVMRLSILHGGAFCIKILESWIQAGQLINRIIPYIEHTYK